MDSVISVLLSVIVSLAFLVLLTRVIPKGVVAFLVLLWLFCIIHPKVQQQILSVVAPLTMGVLPLLLILFGLRILIGGKVRRRR